MAPTQDSRTALSLHLPAPTSATGTTFHTFILGWVVDVEVTVPHDRQLHGQVVDLHPFVGILQPGGEEEESRVTETSEGAGRAA